MMDNLQDLPNKKYPAAINSRKIDFIDNNIVIFNDLSKVPLYDTPIRSDNTLIGLCLEGYNLMGIDGKLYRMVPGTMILTMPSRKLHNVEYSPDFKGVYVAISQQLANEIFPWLKVLVPLYKYSQRRPCVRLTEEELDTMMEYLSLLWKKTIMPAHMYRSEILTALILSIFYEINSIYNRYFPLGVKKENTREKIYQRFIEEVEKNYTKQRKVSFYAGKLNISAKYLNAAVKEYSGQAPSAWIDSYTIYEAKMRLLSSSDDINKIAIGLNFKTASNFSKYFRRSTGYQPKEYRNSRSDLTSAPAMKKAIPFKVVDFEKKEHTFKNKHP